jgi:hypothetical protein
MVALANYRLTIKICFSENFLITGAQEIILFIIIITNNNSSGRVTVLCCAGPL